MDQDFLVKDMIVDGYKLINQLRKENFDVTAAAWVQEDVDYPWYLYIASMEMDKDGAAATRKFSEIRGRMEELYIDTFGVRLIEATDNYAKDILEFYQRHPTHTYLKYRLPNLRGRHIPDAYVYPPAAVPAPTSTAS